LYKYKSAVHECAARRR